MPENDKPIFPRSSDVDDNEKENLYKKTAQKLEEVEKSENKLQLCGKCWVYNPANVIICLDCGSPLNLYDPSLTNMEPVNYSTRTMYGPPAFMMDDKEKYVPRPAYGPPPIQILSYKLWIVVTGLILLTILVIYFFVFRG